MIVQDKSQSDVIQTSNMGSSITGTISSKAMGKLIEMVSNNAYAYPIPSILREIVSNGFDAHTKAGTFENVVLNVVQNEDESYFEIIDKGTGMNPELINEIYMQWGVSDKSESNDFIGGWGLGSKSPFSYTDLFEIITIADNVKYHYYFHNQNRDVYGNKEFTLDLVSDVPTTERNGTTIKITLKAISDVELVLANIREQLSYFNNLTVNVDIDNFTLNLGYVNKFGLNLFNYEKIFEYKTFKYRVPYGDAKEYSSSAYNVKSRNSSNGMFIVIDSVSYPMDRKQIASQYINYIDLFYVGLKFSIGELDVTINREAINYTEKTKESINNRFQEFVNEINEIYAIQHSQFEPNYRKFVVNERKNLKLGVEGNELVINLNDWFYENNQIVKKYEHLKELKLFKPDFNSIMINYGVVGYASGDTLINQDSVSNMISNSSIFNYATNKVQIHQTIFVVDKLSEISKVKNFYLPIKNVIFKELTYEDKLRKFKEFCRLQKISFATINKWQDVNLYSNFSENTKPINYYSELPKILNPYYYTHIDDSLIYKGRKLKYKRRIVPVLGKAIELIKMISHFKTFFEGVKKYSTIEVSDEMLIDYKEYVKELNSQYKRKKEERVIIYSPYRHEVSVDHVLGLAKNIILINKTDKSKASHLLQKDNDIRFIRDLICVYNENVKKDKKKKKYDIIEMSETSQKYIKRIVKKKINLKLLDKSPIIEINDLFEDEYIKKLILRLSFYNYIEKPYSLFDTEERLIKTHNKKIQILNNATYHIYHNYLSKMYFKYSVDKELIQSCDKYFKFTREEYASIDFLNTLMKNKDEYDSLIKRIIKDNPYLSYLSLNTPISLLKPHFKKVKQMNHFYDIPDYVTLLSKVDFEKTEISLY